MEFLESRRSWENQKPPEYRQKSWLFWASPFTMHLVCTLLTKAAFDTLRKILWALWSFSEPAYTLWHKIITYKKLFWNSYFLKITNFTRNFLKMSFFPGDFEGAKFLKNYENHSQGIIFATISRRRVIVCFGSYICCRRSSSPHMLQSCISWWRTRHARYTEHTAVAATATAAAISFAS